MIYPKNSLYKLILNRIRPKIISGWGRTNNNPADTGDRFVSGVFSSILQQLEIPDVPVAECKSRYFQKLDLNKHICAGGILGMKWRSRKNKDICGLHFLIMTICYFFVNWIRHVAGLSSFVIKMCHGIFWKGCQNSFYVRRMKWYRDNLMNF